MRTTDGKVKVIIDNPTADQKLATIAQVTEDDHLKLSDHSERISSLQEEIDKLRQQVAKNNRSGCCIIS